MSPASIDVSCDGGVILIRAIDEDAEVDVAIPLTAAEARSVAAHLTLLASELEAREALASTGGAS